MAATLLRLSSPPVTKQVARAGLAPWQVRRVTAALLDLLAEDTSLTVLAADMGLSPFHFARAVKQSLDLSPLWYRTRLRVDKACHLLRTTTASGIALEVGYETSQSFVRVVVQEIGVTSSDASTPGERFSGVSVQFPGTAVEGNWTAYLFDRQRGLGRSARSVFRRATLTPQAG